jgi:transcriptional regulator with XRE-family HTH domain
MAANLGYPSVVAYELGHRVPSRDTILRLAAALGVHPSELVDEDPVFTRVAR